MKLLLAVFLITIGFVNNLLACPINQQYLRGAILNSSYIILGHVVKTSEEKPDQYGRKKAMATIAVLENLKNKIAKDTIEIHSPKIGMRQISDWYEDNTNTVLFIIVDGNGQYTTCNYGYMPKIKSKEVITMYKQRIFEMQQILQKNGYEVQVAAIVEWLIKCAEVEVTHWDGIYELNYEPVFLPKYLGDQTEMLKNFLTADQKLRLKKILLSTKERVYFRIVDLVYQGNECEIEDYLINRLKVLSRTQSVYLDEYIRRLKHRNNSVQMTSLLEEYRKVQYDMEKVEQKRKVVEAFIKLVETGEPVV